MASRSKDTSVNGWEGWIYKQGSLVPSWKKRYLVLSGQEISYYDREVKDRKAKLKGSFTLAGVQSNKDINNGMTLHGTDGKLMNIYTKTVGEFVMCKNAMENAIAAKSDRFRAEPQQAPVDYRSTSVRTDRSSEAVSDRASDLRSPPQNMRSPYQANQYSLRSQASGEYQQRQYQAPKPTHSGWLEKEGDLVKSWKRRYFVLTGLDIAYYDNVEGSQKGGGRVNDIQLNDNGLQFHLDNNRILRVIADNQDDLQGWYSAVNQALGRPVTDIRRKSSSSYTGAGAQFRRQSSSNQYGGNGYNVASSPPFSQPYQQPSPPIYEPKPVARSPVATTSSSPLPDPKLQSYLDKYMPAQPASATKPEPAFETGVPDLAEQAVASMTPSIVADFSTEFELKDLASPEASLMTDDQQKGQGLWLQRGGSTYVPDETAVPTVIPTRSHIATDIPPPVAKAPYVRTTSSDDLKNKLWVAPSTKVTAMEADSSKGNATTIVKEVTREVTNEVTVVEAPEISISTTEETPLTNSSGLWIQKGGSTYVPDETKVPTVLPTRSHIATDIPPPVVKAPIVRTTSSDDLKKKLWVSPAAANETSVPDSKKRFGVALPGMTPASGVAESVEKAKEVLKTTETEEVKVVETVVTKVETVVVTPAPEPTQVATANDSGLWIQKGGSTYVPDESKVPTVLPTRSHIATDIPPPVAKAPYVRTTSSDDLKKKLWVAPTGIATTTEEVVTQTVEVVKSVEVPITPEPKKVETSASGLWIQKGGSTYVPDETKVPTVLPTRSPIATEIPPPVIREPIVRTTSSDDLKKKLWVAPTSEVPVAAPAKKTAVRGMGSASTTTVAPVVEIPVVPEPAVVVEVEIPAQVDLKPVTPTAAPVNKETVHEVFEEKVVDLTTSPKHGAATKSPATKSPGKNKKTKQVEGAAPKGCCTLM